MFWVYWKCNGLPAIKPVWRKRNRVEYVDFRHRIYWMCLLMIIYNFIHYTVLPDEERARHYIIIEIMRFNVLILLTTYYLRLSSEEIMKRKKYLFFKRLLVIFYLVVMVLLVSGGVILYWRIDIKMKDN